MLALFSTVNGLRTRFPALRRGWANILHEVRGGEGKGGGGLRIRGGGGGGLGIRGGGREVGRCRRWVGGWVRWGGREKVGIVPVI